MDVKDFWDIVEESLTIRKQGTYYALPEFLVQRLSTFEEDEIIDYHRIFNELLGIIWKKSIHKVGIIIESILNSDNFRLFCTCLIYKGRVAYNHILENADDIADYYDREDGISAMDDISYESVIDVADRAFMEKKGVEPLELEDEELPSGIHNETGGNLREKIDFGIYYEENELASKYPRTWNKFRVDTPE